MKAFLCAFLLGLAALLPGQGQVPPTATSQWAVNPGANGAHGTDWAYFNLVPFPGQPGMFLGSHTAYVGNIHPGQGGVGDWDITTGVYDSAKNTYIPDKTNLAFNLNTTSMECCHVLLPGGSQAGLLSVYEWVDGAMGDTWIFDGTTTPPNWLQLTPKNNPPRRYRHAMAYLGDAKAGATFLFGGSTFHQGTGYVIRYFNDTWSWDGSNWSQVMTKTAPSARDMHAMACDGDSKRIVLFGGWDGRNFLGDTWEFDGVNWTRIAAAKSPSPRRATAMAWDSVRDRVVLFGGYDGTNYLNDTWEYDCTTRSWANVTPAAGNPLARSRHAMVYDAARSQVVIFAGLDDGSPALPALGRRANRELWDTWGWNGTGWTCLSTSCTPFRGRYQHAMAFNPATGVIDLFGGNGPSWLHFSHGQWNGIGWSDISGTLATRPLSCTAAQGPFPIGRSDHAMAYDAARKRVVLFGGNGMPYRFTSSPKVNCRKVMLANRKSLTAPWQIVGPITNLPYPCKDQYYFDPAIAYYEFEQDKQELVLLFTCFQGSQGMADIVMAPLNPTTLALDMKRVQVLVRAVNPSDQGNSVNPVVDGKGNLISLNLAMLVNTGNNNNLYFAADLDPSTPPLPYWAGPDWNSNGAYAGGTFFGGEMTWPNPPAPPFQYRIFSMDAIWWTGGRAWINSTLEYRVHTPIGQSWSSVVFLALGFNPNPFSIPGYMGQLGLTLGWQMPLFSPMVSNPVTGRTTWQVPIPNDPVLSGVSIPGQSLSIRVGKPTAVLGNTGTLTIR